ncbi:MAG: hypothetical protein WBM66_02985 [Thiothrix litoralis]
MPTTRLGCARGATRTLARGTGRATTGVARAGAGVARCGAGVAGLAMRGVMGLLLRKAICACRRCWTTRWLGGGIGGGRVATRTTELAVLP